MESDEQETQDRQRPITYQSPMQTYAGSIILLTNPENDLYKMELSMRGLSTDREGNVYKVADPLINNIGINSVISQTQTIVSQVTIMGNLNKNEIPILIDFLGDTLIKDLMVNKLKYGIVSTEARDKIHYLAVSSAFICMKRAFEEGDRRFWGKVQQELTTTIKGQEQKQGIFQKMLGWAK